MRKNFTAITHPGLWHADDLIAAAILRIRAEERDVDVTFERRVPTEEEIKDKEIIVFDIGGVYDNNANTYDHHQKDGAGTRWDDEDAPYSSAGLLWSHFGLELCEGNQEAWDYVEEHLMKPIDRLDNGKGDGGDISLSAVLHHFNPADEDLTTEERDQMFDELVETITGPIVMMYIHQGIAFAEAKAAVRSAAVEEGILVLDKFVPWAEHIVGRPDYEELLYVVFPSLRGGYQVQQVAKEPGSFEGRKPLPECWAGKRGAELQSLLDLTDSGDSTFCHPGRFIGGAENLRDAMKMAKLAVEA
jgi:uncharacterized UPF0160 family protein